MAYLKQASHWNAHNTIQKNLKALSVTSLKFWQSFPFSSSCWLNRFCMKGFGKHHQVNKLLHRHLCVNSLSPVHTLWNLYDQGQQFHRLNMDFYRCLYFWSNQRVSVVPNNWFVLHGPFEAGTEAEIHCWCDGQRQQFIEIILKTAEKGMRWKLYFIVDMRVN